jgi:hypothetical protein
MLTGSRIQPSQTAQRHRISTARTFSHLRGGRDA